MLKEIKLKNKVIKYELQYKNVKNINLRIKPDGSVFVSSGRLVPVALIESFIKSKADFVLNAVTTSEKRKNTPKNRYFTEPELKKHIVELCERIYPYFEARGVKFPVIKFRKMVSQWGNCYSKKGILTFNTNLVYALPECVEYVVAHEFTHFLQPNHSAKFYEELSKIMPDYKTRRKTLKEIIIEKA